MNANNRMNGLKEKLLSRDILQLFMGFFKFNSTDSTLEAVEMSIECCNNIWS